MRPTTVRLKPEAEEILISLVNKTGKTRSQVFTMLLENADVRPVENLEVFSTIEVPEESGPSANIPLPVDNGKLKTTGSGFVQRNFSSLPATSGESGTVKESESVTGIVKADHEAVGTAIARNKREQVAAESAGK